jgi:hypothetical protein
MALHQGNVTAVKTESQTCCCPKPVAAECIPCIKETSKGNRLGRFARHLFRARPRGNKQPEVGQFCLIIKGEIGNDEGQMGIISEQTAVMVRVTYMCKKKEGIATKLKRPSSLVMLDPSVTVVQEKDGTLWIRPCG